MQIYKNIRERKIKMPEDKRKLRWMEAALGHNAENTAMLDMINSSRPELRSYALEIVMHYDSTVPDMYALAKKKYAALSFLTSKDFDSAGDQIAKKLGLIGENARKTLLDTLNEGPKSWLADQAFFEQRGLIRGQSKYYIMPVDLEPGSDYQKFRSMVSPSLLPILAGGVDCVCAGKAGFGLRIQPRVLSYVAAQLLPEGKDKVALFESLRARDKSGSGYTLAVTRSELAVQNISRVLDIDLGDVKLVSVPVPQKRTSPSKTKPAMNDAGAETEADKKEISLASKFNYLRNRGEVTPTEERTYLLIQQKKEAGRNPSAMEIQSLLSKGSVRVSLAEAAAFEKRVDQALEVLQKDMDSNPFKFNPR